MANPNSPALRLLPAIRLSVSTDNTTSPERQMENIRRFAEYKRHTLVPVTKADYDLDVSGSVSPFDRPGLGRWLRPDRLGQWDAIIAAKLDRISRSMFDFLALTRWLEASGKSLVILEPELDLTTKEGRAMANILMTFAEYERETIGARVKEASDRLYRNGNYRGGDVPFGYRPVQLSKNWGYEVDPVYGPVVREMADRFIRYETLGSIVRWLTEEGIPTPKDVARMRSPHEKTRANIRNSRWTTNSVRLILSSASVLGAVCDRKGVPMRDEQGVVLYRAAPLLDDDPRKARDIFERLQARFAATPVPVRVNSSLLLRVAFCASCGSVMYKVIQRASRGDKKYEYAYYRCYGAQEAVLRKEDGCTARRIPAPALEEAVTETLLEVVENHKLRSERIIPGRDYSEECARLIEQVSHLTTEISRARLQRKDYSDLQALLNQANDDLDQIAALDPEEARTEYTDTEWMFKDWWELHDQAARNALLREQGVKVVVSPDPLPVDDLALALPEKVFTVSALDRPGLHAILDLGKMGDLLSMTGKLSITTRA